MLPEFLREDFFGEKTRWKCGFELGSAIVVGTRILKNFDADIFNPFVDW